MAVTTMLKLPEELKARIAPLAVSEGKFFHACMVEALEERVAQSGTYAAFFAEAKAADEKMTRTGEGYAMEDVHEYLLAKLKGKTQNCQAPKTSQN